MRLYKMLSDRLFNYCPVPYRCSGAPEIGTFKLTPHYNIVLMFILLYYNKFHWEQLVRIPRHVVIYRVQIQIESPLE